MPMDWSGLEQAARITAGRGNRLGGAELIRLRTSVLQIVEEASAEVARESLLDPTPRAELLVVDRPGWVAGNIRTLERLFGDLELQGREAKLLAWEGGAFLGLIARLVLGQYDPFRDQLLIVYPNLGDFADAEGLRWLLFHEVTHVAQFRAAPWVADSIVDAGREILSIQRTPNWSKELVRQLPDRIPDLIKWLRDARHGKAATSPIFELLPDAQREAVMRVHALVTLLEGHATHVTDLIAKRVLPPEVNESINQRIAARRNRPQIFKVFEALAGIEMKRQQYVLGRAFCEAIWERGGADALAPAWRGPEWAPTFAELQAPDSWIARVGQPTPA
jgi:coenzyme F420 biosynthesis associated uncharacterized protein